MKRTREEYDFDESLTRRLQVEACEEKVEDTILSFLQKLNIGKIISETPNNSPVRVRKHRNGATIIRY